jgi:tetraacyldisaccharide 4'-kinase
MREPAFWWRAPGWEAALLPQAGLLYGGVAGRQMERAGRDAGVPVVCIGNLTVGGAGKTPTAIAVAQILAAAGRRPFLLSRGYGGALKGPVRVDLVGHRASDVGDEPLLLARVAPTIVARDRVGGAALARAEGGKAIVMDDGFQNPALYKNLAIVVIDADRGIGNGAVCPAGPLRAPLPVQLRHAHAVLVIGSGTQAEPVAEAARAQLLPVFHGRLVPDARAVETLKRRPVLAFAGIGHPEKFFASLREAGVEIRGEQAFPDHHRFRRSEALDLIARAERDGLVLATTEKDVARLTGADDLKALAGVVRTLPVKLAVTEETAFRDMVLARTR